MRPPALDIPNDGAASGISEKIMDSPVSPEP
jgi:hypothetical protein